MIGIIWGDRFHGTHFKTVQQKSGAYNYSADRLRLISKMVQERAHEILD